MDKAVELRTLLYPELESELAKVRQTLERVPEAEGSFKSHEKSRSLASLAGHTADLVSFIEMALTRPDFDFGTEHRTPLQMESSRQLLDAFDANAARTAAALQATTDESFGRTSGSLQWASGLQRLALHRVSHQHI